MSRVSFVAAMCYTLLQKRRRMFPDMEKPRPTFQEARPKKRKSDVGFRHGSGTPFRHPNANAKTTTDPYSQSHVQLQHWGAWNNPALFYCEGWFAVGRDFMMCSGVLVLYFPHWTNILANNLYTWIQISAYLSKNSTTWMQILFAFGDSHPWVQILLVFTKISHPWIQILLVFTKIQHVWIQILCVFRRIPSPWVQILLVFMNISRERDGTRDSLRLVGNKSRRY